MVLWTRTRLGCAPLACVSRGFASTTGTQPLHFRYPKVAVDVCCAVLRSEASHRWKNGIKEFKSKRRIRLSHVPVWAMARTQLVMQCGRLRHPRGTPRASATTTGAPWRTVA